MKRSPVSHRGFTLIEIMVVVVIIAIMAGASTMMVTGRGRSAKFEKEARRLALVLDQLSQEAIFKYMQIGVVFEEDGYSFMVLDEESGQWQPYSGSEKMFKPQTLKDDIKLELNIDGAETGIMSSSTIKELTIIDEEELNKVDIETEEEKKILPQVFMFSSGEMSDFEVTLTQKGSDDYYVISGNLASGIKFRTAEELNAE
ncbi:MAG: type II secretion system protein GspH [Gammaproteobacteria bacterium]|nr:MAG: type II secretion system protein GspH [Gammaproteobacteria bacterium]